MRTDSPVTPSTTDQILNGIQLRSKQDRAKLAGRINEAIAAAVKESFQASNENLRRTHVQHQTEVARLHAAIRTMQRRNFEDITNFASGSPSGLLAGETLGKTAI